MTDEVVKVLRLSHANHARLTRDSKADKANRRLSLTGGVTIEMASTDTDTKVVPTLKDTHLRNGMSAFYRLFAIMASCTEEEFPRAKMADFMSVWAEIQDSPLGTATAKLDGFLAFYDKYVHLLGQNQWDNKLNSDSRWFQENMVGANPVSCHRCLGTGEHDGLADLVATRAPRAAPAAKAATGAKRDRPAAPAYMATQMCASMLVQGRPCPNNCSRLHTPCPSCGGACKSALACVAWDPAVVQKNHGDSLARINNPSARAKRGK